MKTLKNKLYALLLTICGFLSVLVDGDCTLLVVVLMFAIPMFFAKKSWIY